MFETITSGLSGWRRSKTGRSPSPQQIHQKKFCMWNTPTEHLLNVDRWPQTSKNASHSPQNEVGQKIKIKKKRQRIWWGGCNPGVAVVREEKSPHTLRNALTKQGRGELIRGEASHSLLRGEHSNKCLEGKTERIYHRDHVSQHFPAKN